MTTADILRCWNCDRVLADLLLPVSRHAYCPLCAEAVHCCRQCVEFDLRAPAQCRELRAEPPADKTTANFCEWFRPAMGGAGGGSSTDAAAAARAKLEALFGGAAPEDPDLPR
jgi:hypothetical protein